MAINEAENVHCRPDIQREGGNIQRSHCLTDVRVAFLPLIFLTSGVVVVRDRMPAWAFMWALAIVIYASLKWASWRRSPARAKTTAARSVGYLLTWPGMDADSFLATGGKVFAPRASEWGLAVGKTGLGAILLWMIAARSQRMASLAGMGWPGGDGVAGALWELSTRRSVVATGRGGCGANHGQAGVVRIVE